MVVKLDPNNTDALLKIATFYMLGKKFEDSRSQVDAVLGNEPDNIDALYLKSGLDDIDNNLPQAMQAFEKIISIDDKQTRAYIGLARISSRQGKVKAAEDYLRKAIDIDPKDTKPRLAMIGLYTAHKDLERAEAEIMKAIEANPQSAEMHIFQGQFYLQQNKLAASEAAFMKAMELEPQNVKTYLYAARFYDLTGKIDSAKQMYAKAIELNPDDISVLIVVARYYFRVNEIDKSEEYDEKMLASRPGFLPAKMLKGEILASKRKWNEALAVFNQIIEQEPKAAQAYYYKGLAHFYKGDMQVAKSSLNKAIELNAADYRSKVLLADISLRMRDVDMAENLSKEVVEKLPDNPQAQSVLGLTFLAKGQLAEAEKAFRRMIELQPGNPQGYFQLGVAQRLQKNADGALISFGKALEINPKLMDAFSQVVSIYVAQKEYPTAIAKCDNQLAILNDSNIHLAVITNLKGLIYKAQKMDDKAEAEFKAAIEIHENYMQPYYELANLYLQKNQIDGAIDQYKALLAKNANQVRPHMLLGTLYDIQKKFDLSEKHYREALKINPEFAPAANNLAYLLAEKDEDLNGALNFAQQAKEKLPNDPGVMDTIGWIYYKKGLYDSAIAELSDCIEKMQNNATVHYHLGMAYYKAEQGAKAKPVLEKVLALDPKFEKASEIREILAKL
jgi:tetratricopeptide (TPR) repeat protein